MKLSDMNAITILQQEALDYRDLRFDKLLSNLQGNILKGHGRDNTMHIFVRFLENKATEVRKWLSSYAKENITSFKEQLRQRELYSRNQTPGGLFTGIYLTKDFFSYIGQSPDAFNDEAFKAGMKSRTDILCDLKKEEWEPGYQKEIHAMILLAHDNPIELGEQARIVCEEISCPDNPGDAIAEVIDIEYGSAIRNANGDGLEHFGYVDGISQPLFLKDEIDAFKNQNITPVFYDPSAPLNLVLVKDPYAGADEFAFGSYFVFRKLEQHVRDFKKAEEEMAHDLGLTGEDEERMGAMIVGRFEDGTPATLSGADKMISSGIMNNFNYEQDIPFNDKDDKGARCPFHAHIRRSNPRTEESRKHRIARRGITYGHRNVSTTIDQTFVQMPKSGVGLLFMCFQASIEDQFEHIQKEVNRKDDGEAAANYGTCIDLIIGQVKEGEADHSREGKYPVTYNDPANLKPKAFINKNAEKKRFKDFITLKGGEYFFAPSIAYLKSLHSL